MDEENIPSKICQKCLQTLIAIHKLRDESLKNDVKFRTPEFQHEIKAEEEIVEKEYPSLHEHFDSFNDNTSFRSFGDNNNDDDSTDTWNLQTSLKMEQNNTAKPNQFKCEHCNATFKFNSNLASHIRQLHKNVDYKSKWYNKPVNCSVCNILIPQATNLKRHMIQYHDNSLPFGCPECTYKFSNKQTLKHHGMKFHNIRDIVAVDSSEHNNQINIYECDICGKKYLEKISIETHIYKKHLIKNFPHSSHYGLANKIKRIHKCEYCKREFSLRNNLFRHFKHAHPEQLPFQCSQCNQGYRSRRVYLKHMDKVHNIEFPDKPAPETRVPSSDVQLICEFCSEDCGNSKYRYERHLIIVHENELKEILNCPRCNKKYAFKDSLDQHIHWHQRRDLEKSYDYKCNMCDKRFPTEVRLERHKDNNHVEQSSLICHICGKTLSNKSALVFHIKRHSEKRDFQCPQCPQSFVYNKELERHIDSHIDSRKYACTVEGCNKRFNDLYIFQLHKKRHAGLVERKYQCEYCDKKFTTKYALDRHILTHTQERPHACEYCSMAYTQKNDLIKHLREHVGDAIYRCDFEGCNEGFRLKFDLKQHYAVHYVN